MTTWATLEKPFEVEISSNCTCIQCPACGQTSTGEPVECDCCDSTPLMVETRNCTDLCWELPYEDMNENVFPEFLARIGNPDYVRIEGKNMGWLHRSGFAYTPANWKDVWNKITLNGDFTLRIKFEGDNLHIARYSHDEPTGCGLTIFGATYEEYGGE